MLGARALPTVPGVARVRERIRLRGVPGALALGLVSWLVASQCATMTYVMSQDWAQEQLQALRRGSPVIERARGVIIIGVGLYSVDRVMEVV